MQSTTKLRSVRVSVPGTERPSPQPATPASSSRFRPSRRKVLLATGDALFVAAITTLASIRFLIWPFPAALFFAVALPTLFYLGGMYDRHPHRVFLTRMAVVLLMFGAACALLFYWMPAIRPPRGFMFVIIAGCAGVLPAWHILVERIYQRSTRRRLAIIGAGRAGTALIRTLRDSGLYDLVGAYDDDPEKWGTTVQGLQVLGPPSDILHANGSKPETVAVAITQGMSDTLVQDLIQIRVAGVDVVDVVRPYEEVTGRLPVEHLPPGWIAFWSRFSPAHTGSYAKVRRLVDVLGALMLVVLSAPVVLFAMACIKLESRGPVFYRQKRVGQNDRTFTLLKLRTMRADAESGTGAVWATVGDPRVTRVGRILRNIRLDEFPQLINVLRGEMTLIGPRPERPEFVQLLEAQLPHYGLRHMVKPGVTGWAQVCYPYTSSIDDTLVKLEYDLYYIRHRGPFLDARILLKTVGVLLFAQGSR